MSDQIDPIEVTTHYVSYFFMRIWRFFFPKEEETKQVTEDKPFVPPTVKQALAMDVIRQIKTDLEVLSKSKQRKEELLDSCKNRMESHKKTIEELQELAGDDSPLRDEARYKLSVFVEYYKNASKDYESTKQWLENHPTVTKALEARLAQLEALLTESKS